MTVRDLKVYIDVSLEAGYGDAEIKMLVHDKGSGNVCMNTACDFVLSGNKSGDIFIIDTTYSMFCDKLREFQERWFPECL